MTQTDAEIEQAAEIVQRARELCAERGRWSRRAFARDRHRHPVKIESPSAVRFCAAGALLRATFELLPVDDVDGFFDPDPRVPEPLRLALASTGEVFGWALGAWRIGYRQVDGQPQLHRLGQTGRRWRSYTWLEVITLANDANGMTPGIVREALTASVIRLRTGRPLWLFEEAPPTGELGDEGS